MLALIPFFVFGLLWAGFYQRVNNYSQAFFIAAAVWSAVLVVLTEILSLTYALTLWPLSIGWLLSLAVVVYWARHSWQGAVFKSLRPLLDADLVAKLFIFVLVIIAALKGYSALMSAPNTSDAMTYHLTRVEHWVQNASVAHYPTHITRQVYSPVWAEYVITHLRILSGGDYFSNTVQWFSSVGSWVAVAGLARLLGACRIGQLAAVLLAAALPMGLVQSTSTQNDYVLTFWVCGFIYLLWHTYLQPSRLLILASGLALGTAFLTKGNAYIFAPVALAVYVLAILMKRDWKRLMSCLIIIAIAGVFIIPYARNCATFGRPYWAHTSLTNENISPASITATVICNAALHLGTSWEGVNDVIKAGLYGLGSLFNLDLDNPDPNSGADPFTFQRASTGEDDTGNCAQLILWLIVGALMIVHPQLWKKKYWAYAAVLGVMVLVFCLVVRYHPFNGRYHLSIFVLSCVLTGTVLTQLMKRMVIVPVLVIVVCSWPWLLMCNEHPFLGPRSILKSSRMDQYFSSQPQWQMPYMVISKIIQSQNCKDIGLISPENGWEYPWWVLFRQAYGKHFRIEHVEVNNPTGALPYHRGPFNPCALIVSYDPRIVIVLPSGEYVRVWFADMPQGLTSVFLKKQ